MSPHPLPVPRSGSWQRVLFLPLLPEQKGSPGLVDIPPPPGLLPPGLHSPDSSGVPALGIDSKPCFTQLQHARTSWGLTQCLSHLDQGLLLTGTAVFKTSQYCSELWIRTWKCMKRPLALGSVGGGWMGHVDSPPSSAAARPFILGFCR